MVGKTNSSHLAGCPGPGSTNQKSTGEDFSCMKMSIYKANYYHLFHVTVLVDDAKQRCTVKNSKYYTQIRCLYIFHK